MIPISTSTNASYSVTIVKKYEQSRNIPNTYQSIGQNIGENYVVTNRINNRYTIIVRPIRTEVVYWHYSCGLAVGLSLADCIQSLQCWQSVYDKGSLEKKSF